MRRTNAPPDEPLTTTVYLVATMLAAAGGLIGLYAFAHYPPYAWYYIALVAVVAVSSESAVVRLSPTPAVRVALTSVALTTVILGVLNAWPLVREPLTNIDAIGARLNADARESDLVVVHPWLYGISLRRYYEAAAPIVTVPELADFSVHRFDLLKARMQAVDPNRALAARIERTLRAGGRVWLVGDDPVPADDRPFLPLPQPPLPETGWAARPYVLAWGDQIGSLLARHATTREPVPVASVAQPLEHAGLLRFSGWRDRPSP